MTPDPVRPDFSAFDLSGATHAELEGHDREARIVDAALARIDRETAERAEREAREGPPERRPRPESERPPPAERIAYNRREAAALLGVSVDWLDDHAIGDLRTIRRGQVVLIPAAELRRWVEDNAARALRR